MPALLDIRRHGGIQARGAGGVGVHVGGDLQAGSPRRVDPGDHPIHLFPVGHPRRFEVIDLGGQAGLAADRDQLLDGFEEPIERGSATGSVRVVKDPGHSESLVVVRLSIMKVPEAASGVFYERLLELNHASLGRAAFSVDDDGVVFLTAGRPVTDLDPGELIDLILWTSEYADELDDRLLAEFGDGHAL